MFSANENLALRQHKRRVVQYVEECIPSEALDAGTSVMAMQVSCKAPGCVPLETAIVICFPRPFPPPKTSTSEDMDMDKHKKELVPGLKESATGGNYKAKVLMPMSEVTKEDVEDALPPCFIGGKRTMEKLCLNARDVTFGQIEQVMGEEDVEGRKLMAEYLMEQLQEYMARGCVPPEFGKPYEPLPLPLPLEEKPTKEVQPSPPQQHPQQQPQPQQHDSLQSSNGNNNTTSATEWKQQQKIENMFYNSSASVLQKLSERDHAPGIRRPGCPCCDPDDLSNVLDNMMTMM